MSGESDTSAKTPASVYFLLAFMVFVWSINFIVAKHALREFPSLLLGTLRFTLAGLMLVPYYVWERRRHRVPLWETGGLVKLLAVGLVGVGANQLCFLLGLARTSVSHAAILFALTPMTVLLLSSAAGHERITRSKVAGILLAIAGVGLLQLRGQDQRGATLSGDLFILMAMLTFALFTVGGKSLRKDFDGVTINSFAYGGSALVLSPVTLWAAHRFDFSTVSAGAWAALFYMALFPSIIAYLIYYHALRYLGATRLSTLAYLQPVIATAFAVTLLGETITPSLMSGGALILAGVFAAERS
ncbi:MAG: DMT family transporter [Bryobacteraceae bacterium]